MYGVFAEFDFDLDLQKRMWSMHSKGSANLSQYHCMEVCGACEHDVMYMDAKQPFGSLDVEKHIPQSTSIFLSCVHNVKETNNYCIT